MSNLPKNLNKSERDLLILINQQFNNSRNYVNQKRQLFRDRYYLYNNIWEDDNKVYVRLIYSVMQTLISLHYSDNINIHFKPRDLNWQEIAENLNNLAEFDWEEMDLEIKKYRVQWCKFFYWVAIEIRTWWDKKKNVPIIRVIEPTAWVPDLNFDFINPAQYHWFEFITDKSSLKEEDWFFNLNKVMTDIDMKLQQDDYQKLSTRELQNIKATDDWSTSIYYHYVCIDWRKYMIVLSNERSLVIKAEEIEPIGDEEYAEFPIAIRWRSPLRYDPFGVSVMDIMEDKQKMMQLFLNLNRIKAEHAAWGDMFMRDPNAIDNVRDLEIPTMWPKYIKADLNQNPSPIQEVPKATAQNEPYQMPEMLQQQWQEDISIGTRTMWVSWDSSITATENQRVQKNANLKLLLGSKIDNWWEKEFWKNIWYSWYKKFFEWGSKKNIRLNDWIFDTPITLRKSDFITDEDIDVSIYSDTELAEQKDKEKRSLNLNINLILQNPESSQFSKNYAMRKLFELNWTPKEETYIYVEPTNEEVIAKENLELLNRDMEIYETSSDFEVDQNILMEDHLTYIAIYQRALQTNQKQKALAVRWQLYRMSGQMQENRQRAKEQGSQVDKITQNQLVNESLQWERQQQQKASSLQDIKEW